MVKFGLKQRHIDDITGVFLKYPQVECALLFGSRAKGNFRTNSDIDLALKGAIDLTTLLKIETSLDDLLLPYKIDLTNYHKIKNKDLIDHIDRVGVLLYEKI